MVGERWSLLILREAFYGNRRFEQFQQRIGVARNLLTSRLATLVEHGILDRETYQEPGQRARQEYRRPPPPHPVTRLSERRVQAQTRSPAGIPGGVGTGTGAGQTCQGSPGWRVLPNRAWRRCHSRG